MIRATVIGVLFLAVGGCTAPGFGTRIDPPSRKASDEFVRGGTGHILPKPGPRDPKSPDVRPAPRRADLPRGESKSAPTQTAAKAQSAPTAKRGKPCKPRAHVWQVWRPKVCP